MRTARLSARVALAVLLTLSSAAIGCASKEPSRIDRLLTAEELYERGMAQLKPHRSLLFFTTVDTDDAVATFRQIIDNFPASEYALQAELMIAQAYFDDGRFEEASVYYEDFVKSHPTHGSVPQAIYQSGMCKFNQLPNQDRDQTPTKDAAGFFELLINKFPGTPFAEKARERLEECKSKLAEHDYAVAEFYASQNDYHGALNRCSAILANYPGSSHEAEALYCVGEAHFKLDQSDLAREAFQRLVEDFPSDPKAELARGYLARLDSISDAAELDENRGFADEGLALGSYDPGY